ncbi:MAG: polysaccharide deacetylase family protein [Bacteroidia bacterium]
MQNAVLIYSEKPSPRLKYILHIIFKDVYGIDPVITHDKAEFESAAMAKLNYSAQRFTGEAIKIQPFGLLFEYGIRDHLIEVNNHAAYHKLFFRNAGAEVPFDILSAAFWLITRYEEYLPYKPDDLNRFDVKNSLAFQYDFIQLPLVNLWLEEFKKLLQAKYPALKFKTHAFRYISTIDIDNAYKYKHKGLMRTIGGYTKSILQRNLPEIRERGTVLFNKKNDPFDSYDFLLKLKETYCLHVLFFFLLGDYGVNDKNHPANNRDFQKLIKHLADYSEVGIHPSYRSNNNLNQLKTETNRLSNITHREVKNSRQHFSILKFPDSYQALLQTGITHDYSMGYGNYNGFRAGFCMPYSWYDLDSELETSLLIHPFCVIETTLRYNNNATPENAIAFAKPFIDEVKKYGGELISIFHNDTLGDEPGWQGWQKVYEDFLKEVLNS